ncbi:hypothetical protein BC831DRAFT_413345 [Entophlyctis helioformis]|nr:hypothetical protein BC831DRAFT_413345 [Entophlyctis helioformis]
MSTNAPFWCHSCQVEIRPARNIEGLPVCPICRSEFVEEIEGGDPFHDQSLSLGQEDGWETEDDGESATSSTRHRAGGPENIDQLLPMMLQQLLGVGLGGPARASATTTRAAGGDDAAETGGSSSTGGFQFRSQQLGPLGALYTASFTYPPNAGGLGRRPSTDTDGTQTAGTQRSGSPHRPGQPGPEPFAFQGGRSLQEQMLLLMLQQLETMSAEQQRGAGQGGRGARPPTFFEMLGMRGDPGDYVMSQHGLDEIVTQLMEQHSRSTGPAAASADTIRKLPHKPFSKDSMLQHDCPVCQDNFVDAEELVELPCHHAFHPECINSWLKLNGTCPVCRFSLVDAAGSAPGPASGSGGPAADTDARSSSRPQSASTNFLASLFGMRGGDAPSSGSQQQQRDRHSDIDALD